MGQAKVSEWVVANKGGPGTRGCGTSEGPFFGLVSVDRGPHPHPPAFH